MDSDEFYKFIGYAAVVLFFIYILSKVMRINARIIEGLTNTISTKNRDENRTS